MLLAREHLEEVKRLNQEANNQIALAMLPPDWQDDSALHVLALALWGIRERGINVEPPGPGTTMDQVEATVVAMHDWKPSKAMAFIEGDTEQRLALDPDASAETNALWVLEAIRDEIDECRACGDG
jgi:hypothetical protein